MIKTPMYDSTTLKLHKQIHLLQQIVKVLKYMIEIQAWAATLRSIEEIRNDILYVEKVWLDEGRRLNEELRLNLVECKARTG